MPPTLPRTLPQADQADQPDQSGPDELEQKQRHEAPLALTLKPLRGVKQSGCRLLSLPPHVRNRIWRLVVAKPFSFPWTKPLATRRGRVPRRRPRPVRHGPVALLRTCRAIYADAWHLPLQLATLLLYDDDYLSEPTDEDLPLVDPRLFQGADVAMILRCPI